MLLQQQISQPFACSAVFADMLMRLLDQSRLTIDSSALWVHGRNQLCPTVETASSRLCGAACPLNNADGVR